MDAQLLKIMGGVAGLAGVAVGMILLLYRDIIRQNVFPKLSQTHAYRLLQTIAILAWSVAMAGLACWAWSVRVSPHGTGGAATATAASPAPLVVAGTVVDRATNDGIGQAIVSAGAATAVSEDNGNFEIRLDKNIVGRIRVTATKSGYVGADQSVVPPVQNVVLQLSRPE